MRFSFRTGARGAALALGSAVVVAGSALVLSPSAAQAISPRPALHPSKVKSAPVRAGSVAPSPLGADAVVTYVPQGSGDGTAGLSSDLWATYDQAQVSADLGLIEGMGANAVRVFIGTGDTGAAYPVVSGSFSAHLSSFVRQARADHLKVVLSIFNMYPYVPSISSGWIGDEPNAKAWMASLLGPYRSDPDVAYVEMRNEIPAPGYDAPNPAGSGVTAASWLNDMMPVLRNDAGTDPVVLSQNLGVAGYEALDAALSAANKPDAYSYHFYDSPGFLTGQLQTLAATLSRPVFVGETGYSTYTGYTQGGGARLAADQQVRDTYQAWYLQAVASVTSSLGMGVPGVWDLWDTAHASTASEANFGLYDLASDGTAVAKPAVAALSAVYADQAAGIPVAAPSNNGTFDTSGAGAGQVPAPWQAYYVAGSPRSGGALSGNSLCVTKAGYDSYYFEVLPLTALGSAAGSHTLTAWSLGGNSYTSVAVRWLSSTGATLGTDARTWQSSTAGSWTPLRVASTPPAGASAVEVILQADTGDCFSNVALG